MNDEYTDPIDTDAAVELSEADRQRQVEITEQFVEFRQKYPLLYEWMHAMPDEDEAEAVETLIMDVSESTNQEQRQIIGRCRYFKQWLEEATTAVQLINTQTEPPEA